MFWTHNYILRYGSADLYRKLLSNLVMFSQSGNVFTCTVNFLTQHTSLVYEYLNVLPNHVMLVVFFCIFLCYFIRLCPDLNLQVAQFRAPRPAPGPVKQKSPETCKQCGLTLKDKYSLRRHVSSQRFTRLETVPDP